MKVIERDILQATVPLQNCIGVSSACKAAIHATDRLFSWPSAQGILLVDASNAFNAINRTAALYNVPHLCPAMAQIMTNTYGKPIRLFFSGGGKILSKEGTCLGDALAMAIYAVAVTPLIRHLQQACPSTTQTMMAQGTICELYGNIGTNWLE